MNLTFTLDEIQSVAKLFIQQVTHRKIFAFHGQMGAGKTTLIHALCNEWQVKDIVSSPTFSIINEYDNKTGSIFHIDLYRLTDMEEAINAGVEDCICSGSRCLVEWPERAAALFPDDTVHVYLHAINEQTRHLRIADK